MKNVQHFDRLEAERKWNADPALRTEFNGDLECFLAYEKAMVEGHVKILGRDKSKN